LKQILKNIRSIDLEACVWLMALIMLAITDPTLHHFTLCPLANLGFEFCPGCGLGRSISFLLHGEFAKSMAMHPMGIFALMVLLYRIVSLTKLFLKQKTKSHG